MRIKDEVYNYISLKLSNNLSGNNLEWEKNYSWGEKDGYSK